MITGAVTGFVIGLTSAGSGTLIAIALIAIFRLTPQRVVGTDVFHAAVLLWAAGFAHWIGGNIDFALAGEHPDRLDPGVILGTNLSVKAPQTFLRYALAVVLIASGTTLIIKEGTPDVVIPAIGVATVMIGVLFGAQAVSRGRSKRGAGHRGARRPSDLHPAPRRAASPQTSRYFPPLAARRGASDPMIAFGCSITKPDVYERCAARGFRLAAEPDTKVLAYGATGSIFRSYNLLLEKARELDDLEALVLVHQDAEIVDPDFCRKLRGALEDPDVALVGCAGATGQRSIAWWEGSVTWASFSHRYEEYGGGEIPAMTYPTGTNPSFSRAGEVDAIDGAIIGMSPWAVRELGFDESLGGLLHGYDFDICCQARAKGRKVVTADLQIVHHHTIELIDDVQSWLQAYMKLARKWDDGSSENGAGWQERARQAEAEAAAAKLLGGMADLVRQAQATRDAEERAELERELERIRKSASWRLTAPFRALTRTAGRRG